jgi:hypothetical protein
MTRKLSRGEASTTLSMIAHRTGRPPQNEELLNVVDRLSPDSGEVVAPGLLNGIFVPVRVPVQMKSLREITQGFSPN